MFKAVGNCHVPLLPQLLVRSLVRKDASGRASSVKSLPNQYVVMISYGDPEKRGEAKRSLLFGRTSWVTIVQPRSRF